MKPSILYQFLEWDCKLHRVSYFVLIAECSAKNKVKHVSFLPNIHSSVLIHESQIYSIFFFSVIEQLGGKQMVMQYLSHEDPNVRFEALIAVQKLMVHNWWVKARNSHLYYTCVVEVELLAWHFYKETDYLSVLYIWSVKLSYWVCFGWFPGNTSEDSYSRTNPRTTLAWYRLRRRNAGRVGTT